MNAEKCNQDRKELKQKDDVMIPNQPKLVKNFINMGYFKEEEDDKQKLKVNIIEKKKLFRPLRKLNVIPK